MPDTETLNSLLKEWYEIHSDPCWYDHHGYCQAHFLEDKGQCIVERTKKVLEEISMPEEWFEVAYINFDKAILHGRVMGERDENLCRKEIMIEQVLTEDQKRAIEDLNFEHENAMQALLKSFVA